MEQKFPCFSKLHETRERLVSNFGPTKTFYMLSTVIFFELAIGHIIIKPFQLKVKNFKNSKFCKTRFSISADLWSFLPIVLKTSKVQGIPLMILLQTDVSVLRKADSEHLHKIEHSISANSEITLSIMYLPFRNHSRRSIVCRWRSFFSIWYNWLKTQT